MFGFLGPNGAGKTTTIRILLGLVRPTSGRAWVNGRPVPAPAGLSRIGAMIEEPAFYPWLSGRRSLEVLALSGPQLPHRDAIGSALERTGLAAVADRKVKGYSQGMRQRLGLAAALMRAPVLLLLDEPANGMDPAGIKEFRVLLRALADDGTTVFLSSHLLAEVEHVCDEVAVLDSGHLVRQGRIADLAATLSRVRVQVDPAQQAAASGLLRRWHITADGPGSLLIESADVQTVSAALSAGGVSAKQITNERSGLEEIFLRLTGESTDTEAHDAASAR